MTQELTSAVNPSAPAPPAPEAAQGGPAPEDILADLRWILHGREEGFLDQYAGQHIAVVGQKVLGSDRNLHRLRQTMLEQFGLDPARLVTAYIDPE